MKVNIYLNIGRATDPAPTLAHYTRARWIGKNKVILSGTAECQGKRWSIKHEYHIPYEYYNMKKEEIIVRKFGWLLGAFWVEVMDEKGRSVKKYSQWV